MGTWPNLNSHWSWIRSFRLILESCNPAHSQLSWTAFSEEQHLILIYNWNAFTSAGLQHLISCVCSWCLSWSSISDLPDLKNHSVNQLFPSHALFFLFSGDLDVKRKLQTFTRWQISGFKRWRWEWFTRGLKLVPLKWLGVSQAPSVKRQGILC